ncbi:MAG TPA: entericidin A/B family lipoprotein [Burkholderiaceae bacterium]|jgi:predicted small secreted protein|nr:entericidin A/B family lipoprotein [Burkholderiaceae bacterium]
MFKQLSLALAAVLTLLSLGACNTVQGVGRDIEKAGEGIQGAAKK